MSIFTKTKAIITSLIALFALAVAQPVAAADITHSISISPADQYIALRPGEQYHTSVRVSNQASATEDLKFTVSATPFSVTGGDDPSGDYSQNFDVNNGDYNQIVDWISFDQEGGVLAPNKNTQIGITIDVPADAPAGGQYVGIAVTDESDSSGGNGSNIAVSGQRRAVMLIYASVAGETRQTGSVLETGINAISLSSPISATALFENTGNVHVNAKCILKVRSFFSDEEIYSNEDDETNTHTIMPGTRRFITTSWDNEKSPHIGLFKVEQAITYLGQTTTTTQVVAVMPTWLLFVIVFFIVFWVAWFILRSKKKRQDKSTPQPTKPAKVIDIVQPRE